MEVDAIIHSLNGGMDKVEILHESGCNDVIALYNGKRCTAIFNPFVGQYYVDDKYGVLPDQPSRPETPALKNRTPTRSNQDHER